MNSAAILLAMAMFGVDVGWQELEDGSIEYIIQIEPQLVGSLQDGHDLTSGIRPELRNIRRYRVVVGSADLPHNPPLAELKRRWAAEKDAATKNALAEQPTTSPKVPSAFKDPPPPIDFTIPPLEDPQETTPKVNNPFGQLNEPTPAEEKDEPTAAPSLEDSGSVPPSTFRTDDTAKPLINHVAAYAQTEPADAHADAASEEAAPTPATPSRSWGTLVAVLLALFASVGLNAFLGWVTVEQRGRYRSLLARNTAS
jgi:hypothetical protein